MSESTWDTRERDADIRVPTGKGLWTCMSLWEKGCGHACSYKEMNVDMCVPTGKGMWTKGCRHVCP